MAASGNAALDVALACHNAWVSGDMDRAFTYFHPNVVCDAPRAGHVEGAEIYRTVLSEFQKLLTGSKVVAAFGDDEHALILFDTHSDLVASSPTVTHVKVADGKIVYVRIIFDQAPWIAARTALGMAL